MNGPGGDNDWARNGIVWPDRASADSAGLDLLMRCCHFADTRPIPVDEEPNRPTWTVYLESK